MAKNRRSHGNGAKTLRFLWKAAQQADKPSGQNRVRQQRDLDGTGGPAACLANRRERIPVQWRRTMLAQSFQVIGRGIAFVAPEAILRIDRIPLFHAGVTMRFRQDRSGSDRNAAAIAFDQGFLLDQDIELQGIDQQVVWNNGKLLQGSGHSLSAGLVDIPRINALRIYLGNGPGKGVFADALSQLCAALRCKLFRVVEPDNTALWVQNHCGGNHWPEQGATSGLIQAGDARPAKFARRSLETGRAEAAHFGRDFSTLKKSCQPQVP